MVVEYTARDMKTIWRRSTLKRLATFVSCLEVTAVCSTNIWISMTMSLNFYSIIDHLHCILLDCNWRRSMDWLMVCNNCCSPSCHATSLQTFPGFTMGISMNLYSFIARGNWVQSINIRVHYEGMLLVYLCNPQLASNTSHRQQTSTCGLANVTVVSSIQ